MRLSEARLGLDYLAVKPDDNETMQEFTQRMEEVRRRYPLRFAALNFRCIIAALAAIIEHDRLEDLSAPLLILMIQALEQAERAAGRCRECALPGALQAGPGRSLYVMR